MMMNMVHRVLMWSTYSFFFRAITNKATRTADSSKRNVTEPTSKGVPKPFVNVIHKIHLGFSVEAFVAKKLSHMRPVLLLNMGIVIFLVWPSANELDTIFSIKKITVKIMV